MFGGHTTGLGAVFRRVGGEALSQKVVATDGPRLVTRSHQKTATATDFFCESCRYAKSVDNGVLVQMERLLQFGRVLSRCV